MNSGAGLLFSILVTQILVFFGWLIFRAESFENLMEYIMAIFYSTSEITTITKVAIVAGIFGLIVIFVLMLNKKFADTVNEILYFDYLGIISRQKMRYWSIYLVFFITMILFLSPPETPEFIYFAF